MIFEVNVELVGNQVGAIRGGAEGGLGEIGKIQQRHHDHDRRDQCHDRAPQPCLQRHLSVAARLHLGGAVLLEFVEQGLETDAEDFGGSRLIVAGMLQRQLNKRLLGLAHGSADGQPHGVRLHFLLHGPRAGGNAKIARQDDAW